MIKESLKSIPGRGYKYAGAGLLSLLSLSACTNDSYKVGEVDFIVTCPPDQPKAIAVPGRFQDDVFVVCHDPADDPNDLTSKPVSVELLTVDAEPRPDAPGENVLNIRYSYIDAEHNILPVDGNYEYQSYFHSELALGGISSVIATSVES